jgi:hypothetical protein
MNNEQQAARVAATVPPPPMITFGGQQQVSADRVRDLLCCALEGGSNYWYHIVDFIRPTPSQLYRDWQSMHLEALKAGQLPREVPHLDFPLSVGGGLVITSLQGDEHLGRTNWHLNLQSIAHGLDLMKRKYLHHWETFEAENEDADTGDVFLQCCLFGDVVYG